MNDQNEQIRDTAGLDPVSDGMQPQSTNNEKHSTNEKSQEQRHYSHERHSEKQPYRHSRYKNERHEKFEKNEPEENFDNIDKTKIIQMLDIKAKSYDELLKLAEEHNVEDCTGMLKQEVVFLLLKTMSENGYFVESSGILEVVPEGFGFLRYLEESYASCPDDIYVTSNIVRKFNLRTGDAITGYARAPRPKEKYFALQKITSINGIEFEKRHIKKYPNFDNLTPIFPQEVLNFDITLPDLNKNPNLSTRIISLISPIGKGQRALIVAPPRVGKTILMQSIAHAIAVNHPDIHLIYLGIDERPEEFTDMVRSVKGEVVASTFDEQYSRHVSLAEIVVSRAKRMVEQGRDVVILLDSITRLARAYNNVLPSSGKVLTGGVDANALQAPKRLFGAARNIENGGSLTIIATALVETGSRMDEVIFEEFKGTGNSEIILDRKLADKRIFPAIDVLKSGTRREEEMIDPNDLTKMWMLRKILSQMSNVDAMEFLLDKIRKTKDNEQFFKLMNTA